jgi:hypothetical protein
MKVKLTHELEILEDMGENGVAKIFFYMSDTPFPDYKVGDSFCPSGQDQYAAVIGVNKIIEEHDTGWEINVHCRTELRIKF